MIETRCVADGSGQERRDWPVPHGNPVSLFRPEFFQMLLSLWLFGRIQLPLAIIRRNTGTLATAANSRGAAQHLGARSSPEQLTRTSTTKRDMAGLLLFAEMCMGTRPSILPGIGHCKNLV